MTSGPVLWDDEQDRLARFNAPHGHAAGCEFVVDDWMCAPECPTRLGM